MAKNNKFDTIQTSFDKDSSDLYRWATEEAKRRPLPLAWLGREAFATLRLFGSLEKAQQAKKLLEAIKGYAAGDNWQDILFPGDDEPEIEDWLKNMFG